MLRELMEKWKAYCTAENFIGIGSTRKAFRVKDYVLKVNIHPLGYQQSKNEFVIYKAVKEIGLTELFAEIYMVDELLSIQKYYHPLEMENNQTYEIDMQAHRKLIPERYKETLDLLDTKFDSFDLKDSSNYGLNAKGKLTFIDYGMNKSLYEAEWVPLAKAGILPQIHFDYCKVCGIEKELRMYGENDSDKRCYSCGKE